MWDHRLHRLKGDAGQGIAAVNCDAFGPSAGPASSRIMQRGSARSTLVDRPRGAIAQNSARLEQLVEHVRARSSAT
jgi:hypothetical protein